MIVEVVVCIVYRMLVCLVGWGIGWIGLGMIGRLLCLRHRWCSLVSCGDSFLGIGESVYPCLYYIIDLEMCQICGNEL